MPAIIAILIIGAGIQLFFVYIDTTGLVLLLLLTLGPIIYGTIWCTFHPYWKAVKAYEKAAGAFITPNALVVQDLPQLPRACP